VPRAKPETGGWDDRNRRVTFYCPVDVEEAIDGAIAATGRSKTQVIVDALRAQLLEAPAGVGANRARRSKEPTT
jgi:hypothetical protein